MVKKHEDMGVGAGQPSYWNICLRQNAHKVKMSFCFIYCLFRVIIIKNCSSIWQQYLSPNWNEQIVSMLPRKAASVWIFTVLYTSSVVEFRPSPAHMFGHSVPRHFYIPAISDAIGLKTRLIKHVTDFTGTPRPNWRQLASHYDESMYCHCAPWWWYTQLWWVRSFSICQVFNVINY